MHLAGYLYEDYHDARSLEHKKFSGLSIMAQLAQMKLPRIQRHLRLWFLCSIFIPVNFHKAVILASWIRTWRAVFFSRILQNGPKFGTASDSYFPLSWVYNSISKNSDTLHYGKPQTHKKHLGTEFETRAKHRFGLSALLNQVVYFVKYLPNQKKKF
jgi:hypothetical protein